MRADGANRGEERCQHQRPYGDAGPWCRLGEPTARRSRSVTTRRRPEGEAEGPSGTSRATTPPAFADHPVANNTPEPDTTAPSLQHGHRQQCDRQFDAGADLRRGAGHRTRSRAGGRFRGAGGGRRANLVSKSDASISGRTVTLDALPGLGGRTGPGRRSRSVIPCLRTIPSGTSPATTPPTFTNQVGGQQHPGARHDGAVAANGHRQQGDHQFDAGADLRRGAGSGLSSRAGPLSRCGRTALIVAKSDASISGRTVTLDPGADLVAHGQTVTISYDPSPAGGGGRGPIRDLAGNNAAGLRRPPRRQQHAAPRHDGAVAAARPRWTGRSPVRRSLLTYNEALDTGLGADGWRASRCEVAGGRAVIWSRRVMPA